MNNAVNLAGNYTSVNTQNSDQRRVGDLDMIQCVRDILVRNGLKNKVEQLFDTDVNIIFAKDLGPKAQRDVLIAFWSLQFMSMDFSGFEERACLNLPFSDTDWIRVFVEKLVPFIVDNDLPRGLYGRKPQGS